jgi:hypothetical protein
MKGLNKAGGAILLVVLIALGWAGLQSPSGRRVRAGLGEAWSGVWGPLRGSLPSFHLSTHALTALVIGLAGFVALLLFVPPARGGTGLLLAAVGAVVAGFLLYTTGTV